MIHWMTTGSLAYPFARTALGSGSWRRRVGPDSRVDLSAARQIIELAVHRESVERVLTESPQTVQAMLDALQEALLLETGGQVNEIQVQEEGRDEEVCLVSFKP